MEVEVACRWCRAAGGSTGDLDVATARLVERILKVKMGRLGLCVRLHITNAFSGSLEAWPDCDHSLGRRSHTGCAQPTLSFDPCMLPAGWQYCLPQGRVHDLPASKLYDGCPEQLPARLLTDCHLQEAAA
jgi:hypothetical protein